MSANRRRFLQMAGIAPAGAVASVMAAPRPAAKAADSMLTCSEFARCVGDTFIFEKAVFGDVNVKLAAVAPLAGCTALAQREDRFSLRFEASGEGSLEQASYRVHHARLGDFVMFVSPRDAEGRVVEAVFNRL